jgi:hypothetical protein
MSVSYMLFIAHLCNHILLTKWWWDLGTDLYTVRGVGSGSRDVDVWAQTSLYTSLYVEDRGLCLDPMDLDHSRTGPDPQVEDSCFDLSDWTTLIVYK